MAQHDEHRDRRNVQPGTGEPDEQDDLERALQREPIDLPGDMEEDRNLSGSSTYETLAEEAEAEGSEDAEEMDLEDLEDPDDLDGDGRIFLDDNR